MNSVLPRVLIGLVALGGALWLGGALLEPSAPPAQQRRWTSSQDCQECHAEVYAEWEDSWHAKAYIDPDVREQSKEFSNTDCIDCHAPKPVFVTGVGKRVLPRADRRHEGVDCLSCHLLPNGDIAGTITSPSAPCRPVATVDLQRVDYCGVCHNQHKTVDQWRATHYAEEGTGCVECHMPHRDGDVNKGRYHQMAGGHDLGLIQGAISLRARRVAGAVKIEVENHSVGHAYPTDERSRASDVWWRPVDSEDWHHLYRIRDPYRYESDIPRTLLDAGETKVLVLDDPAASQAIEVMLVYKLSPYYRRPDTGEPISTSEVVDPLIDSQEVHRVLVPE
ncbi:MAG: multiheme c-type cytochrome [Planctomycetota bacterium]|nr:multiheme c-type cytochrome [Planctomycetota bacterium]